MAALVLLATAARPAAAVPYVYSAHVADGTVSVVDAATGTLKDRFEVGTDPENATLSAAGDRLYVLVRGEHALAIVDTATDRVVFRVPLQGDPIGIAVPERDDRVYVALQQNVATIQAVAVVNPKTGQLLQTLNLGYYAGWIAAGGTSGTLYVEDGSVCALRAYGGTPLAEVASHLGACSGDNAVVSREEDRLYVTSLLPGEITAYALPGFEPLYAVDPPWGGGDAPSPIAISDDGSQVVIGELGSNVVVILDTEKGVLSAPIQTCLGPSAVGFSPDQRWIFVSCSYSGVVKKLDASTHAVVDEFAIAGPYSVGRFVGDAPETLYVANGSAASVAKARLPQTSAQPFGNVGQAPEGVVASPDGRYVYATNGGAGTVSVLATETGALLATIPVGVHPVGMTITADGTRLYVANLGDDSVSIIDTATRQVVWTLHVDAMTKPRSVALSPDGTKLYVLLSSWYFVFVYDTATDVKIGTVYAPYGLYDIVTSPDGKLYASSGINYDIYKIDPATDTVVADWSAWVGAAFQTHAMGASPDGSKVYVASNKGLTILDHADGHVIAAIPTGDAPAAIVAGRDGRYVYVTNPVLGTISVIDTTVNRVTRTIGGLSAPAGMAAGADPLVQLIFRNGFE